MIEQIITKIFGDPDTKKIKKYSKELEKIKVFIADMQNYTLEDIQKELQKLCSILKDQVLLSEKRVNFFLENFQIWDSKQRLSGIKHVSSSMEQAMN